LKNKGYNYNQDILNKFFVYCIGFIIQVIEDDKRVTFIVTGNLIGVSCNDPYWHYLKHWKIIKSIFFILLINTFFSFFLKSRIWNWSLGFVDLFKICNISVIIIKVSSKKFIK